MGINKEIGGKRVMSDLTNEELIATRKLHGLDDNLFEEEIEVGEYVRTDKGYESYMANCYKVGGEDEC